MMNIDNLARTPPTYHHPLQKRGYCTNTTQSNANSPKQFLCSDFLSNFACMATINNLPKTESTSETASPSPKKTQIPKTKKPLLKRSRTKRKTMPTKENDMIEAANNVVDTSNTSCDNTMPVPKMSLKNIIIPCQHQMESSDSDDDSDDSDCGFVISFSATPKQRPRQVSVTDSEDSFIVFDGPGGECSFSDDMSESDTDLEDDEEEEDDMETWEDAYGEDVVDWASSDIPSKRVRFVDDSNLCEIHPMIQWSFAYKAARKGPWEEYARDRERFKRRMHETEKILLPIFDGPHRQRIYQDRFNATQQD